MRAQRGGRGVAGALGAGRLLAHSGLAEGLTRLHGPTDDPQDVGGVPQFQAVVDTHLHLAGEVTGVTRVSTQSTVRPDPHAGQTGPEREGDMATWDTSQRTKRGSKAGGHSSLWNLLCAHYSLVLNERLVYARRLTRLCR